MRKLESTLSQNTVADHIVIQGTGLHSGADAILRIHPAKADNGIIFMRSDVSDRNNLVPALWDHVVDTKLCTVIGNKDGVSIGTIEHLMAALNAMNITNAMIELDGPEVPIMDGSSLPFITAIKKVGISAQNAPQKAIKILEEITFKEDDKFVTLSPSEFAEFSITIDFDHKSIGKQSFAMRLDADNFAKDISDARTFGFLHEFNHLRSLGLCLGGTLENAVALDGDKVLNPEGLRHDDEFARHKLLDAVGDIYLAGHRIIGTYKGYKSGHAVNNQALRALYANPDKWALVDMKNTAFNIKEVAA